MRKFIGLLLLAAAARAQQADLILHNGSVYTVDPQRPRATAVAIRGDTIVRVGPDQAVMGLRGPQTRIIDLAGRMLLPGFNDAHTHFENAVLWFYEVRLIDTADEKVLLQRLAEAVHRVPKGMWITATDWGLTPSARAERQKTPFTPPRASLEAVDAIAPDHPVLLRRYDHAYFANSKALALAGIRDNTTDPGGGRYERDSRRRFTGMLYGVAGENLE